MGRSQTHGLPAVVQTVEQQGDEQNTAEHTHHQLDGQLVGGDHRPADDVADQHEQCAEQRGVGQGSPYAVALKHGHHVGHDQAHVGDGAHHDHNGRGDHGGDAQAHKQHQVVGNPQIPGKIPAKAHDVEVVGEHEGQDHQGHGQVDDLVLVADLL